MGIVGFSFSSGSLRSHSRNEAYYAKMAKHKDLIVSKLRGDDVLGLVTSEVGGADDYANNRQKYARR